jgi:homoserine O-acetyltransferase
MRFPRTLTAALVGLLAPVARAADVPRPTEGDWSTADYRFADGQVLASLHLHYRTLGTPRSVGGHVVNAVLVLHGTTGDGGQFFRPEFAGRLFGPGQPLDAARFYLILPDDIGHGKSSRPSEGLHARFPAYRYADMVDAEHRLVTDGLHVDHLRLVMGTSMGGMHTWMWGETYPNFMDALMPLASLPEQISGRNRVWRKIICDSIRNDPEWNNGDYQHQPDSLRTAAEILYFMGSNPLKRYEQAPTGAKADEVLNKYVGKAMKTMDANDVLYAVDSSRDYDPAPKLEAITAPLLAVNSADDLINPPDLGILETEIKRVKSGKAVTIPEGPETQGHGTHTLAKVWKDQLAELLKESV